MCSLWLFLRVKKNFSKNIYQTFPSVSLSGQICYETQQGFISCLLYMSDMGRLHFFLSSSCWHIQIEEAALVWDVTGKMPRLTFIGPSEPHDQAWHQEGATFFASQGRAANIVNNNRCATGSPAWIGSHIDSWTCHQPMSGHYPWAKAHPLSWDLVSVKFCCQPLGKGSWGLNHSVQ